MRLLKVLTAGAAAALLGGCFSSSHKLDSTHEIKPVEIKPIHITIDVNVKVDKALDDFFGDLDKKAGTIEQKSPAAPAAPTPAAVPAPTAPATPAPAPAPAAPAQTAPAPAPAAAAPATPAPAPAAPVPAPAQTTAPDKAKN
jgi:hypothetical protein